jgi:Rps23 Pro-64 3,4-dihydroxylase Tpa1-like proline 4-hydroxylase
MNQFKELAQGIVVANNIGEGMGYINKIENFVSQGSLSWVPHNQKKIKEDEDKKAMDTMYIRNVRRWGTQEKDPSPKELLHEELFNRFDRDFVHVIQSYIEQYKVPCSQREDYEILKYGEGNFFIDHVDDGLYLTRKVSLVYYFNDDYEGGEIHFPRFDVTIKPKEGQLILFPASYIYNHNVTEVTKGTRYSMVNWLK